MESYADFGSDCTIAATNGRWEMDPERPFAGDHKHTQRVKEVIVTSMKVSPVWPSSQYIRLPIVTLGFPSDNERASQGPYTDFHTHVTAHQVGTLPDQLAVISLASKRTTG